MTEATGLRIIPEWEAAEGVSTPELRATWARLEIHVGEHIVTQVEDAASGSVRRSVYLPAYPLAEWIAFNWWYLHADGRPGALPERESAWSFRSRLRPPRHRAAWLTHHNLRAVGEGFPWPDLTLVPQADATLLAWQGDRSPLPGWRVRFLSRGQAELPRVDAERSLSTFVEAVLTRLDEQGVHGTPLEKEWRALRELDDDEVAFCMASARLGLDPFSLPDAVTELVLQSAEQLEGALLDDFLDGASPARLREGLDWIAETSDVIAASDGRTRDLPPVTSGAIPRGRAWERGLADARALRDALDLSLEARVDLEPWIAVEQAPRVDRALAGLGGRTGASGRMVALAGRRSVDGERFAAARALWRFLGDDAGRFLVTTASTPTQQAERAFAAEFLAPASGIERLLGLDDDEPVDPDEVAEVSEHFAVNDLVIAHQIVNNLGREVDAPGLGSSARGSSGPSQSR